MSQTPRRLALVTGAGRGLGLEIVRQLHGAGLEVVLSSRDGLVGKAAADKLLSEGLDVHFFPLDVTRPDAIRRVQEFVGGKFGRLDVLVNNAGIMPGSDGALELSPDDLQQAMQTNLHGPLQLIQALAPLMRRNRYGRIVNVSSRLAQLDEMHGGYTAYRLSKCALNALTRNLAPELKQDNILINSVSPGAIRQRPLAEAAGGIVWAATLDDDGPTGGWFEDGQPLAW